jgi:hypothetical protein
MEEEGVGGWVGGAEGCVCVCVCVCVCGGVVEGDGGGGTSVLSRIDAPHVDLT